jgi:hypothetical protein
MVPLLLSHKRYLRFVRTKAGQFGGFRTDHRHYPVWRKLSTTNLDRAYPLFAALYCRERGRPARCPLSLFRSCLALMRDEPF